MRSNICSIAVVVEYGSFTDMFALARELRLPKYGNLATVLPNVKTAHLNLGLNDVLQAHFKRLEVCVSHPKAFLAPLREWWTGGKHAIDIVESESWYIKALKDNINVKLPLETLNILYVEE